MKTRPHCFRIKVEQLLALAVDIIPVNDEQTGPNVDDYLLTRSTPMKLLLKTLHMGLIGLLFPKFMYF